MGFRSGQVATRAAESPLLRFFLSHFPTGRASRKLPGPTGPRSCCADARFAIATRSSATVAVASRLTMNIMTGLRSGAASVTVVARRAHRVPMPNYWRRDSLRHPGHMTPCLRRLFWRYRRGHVAHFSGKTCGGESQRSPTSQRLTSYIVTGISITLAPPGYGSWTLSTSESIVRLRCPCNAEPGGHIHQVGQGFRLHFLHHPASMCLHCDFADAEFATNLFIHQACHH